MQKRCPTCGVTSDNFGKNARRRDGLQSECRTCRSARDAVIYADRGQQILAERATPEGRLRRQASRHGLTVEQLRALIDKYDGKCWICQVEEGRAVDHCHVTERRRGWLCDGCNRGLGQFRDDPAVMRRAIEYLAEPSAPQHDRRDGNCSARQPHDGMLANVMCPICTPGKAPCWGCVFDSEEHTCGGLPPESLPRFKAPF